MELVESMQRVIGKEELDYEEKEVLVDFSLDYFYQELEKAIDVRTLRTMVKSLHRKVSNTKDKAFIPLIERVLERSLELEDNFSLFYLYDLKFDLIWLNPNNAQKSSEFLDKMVVLANNLLLANNFFNIVRVDTTLC